MNDNDNISHLREDPLTVAIEEEVYNVCLSVVNELKSGGKVSGIGMYNSANLLHYYSAMAGFSNKVILEFNTVDDRLLNGIVGSMRCLGSANTYNDFAGKYVKVRKAFNTLTEETLFRMMLEITLYMFSNNQPYGAFIFSDFISKQYILYRRKYE